jgi:hypothetical protein
MQPSHVRSTPIPSAPARRRISQGDIASGTALIAFGVLLWLAGAKYTLVGWVYGLNWFLLWMGLPALIPAIVGWWMLLAIPMGLVYSFVELRRPWNYTNNDWAKVVLVWLIWLIIVGTDAGSTYLGVRQPPPDAWLVTRQVAASTYLSGGWSTLLTFVPEWFIIGGLALLRR